MKIFIIVSLILIGFIIGSYNFVKAVRQHCSVKIQNIIDESSTLRKDRDRLNEIIRANHPFIEKPVECINVCHSGYCQKYKKDFDSKVVEILGDKSCPYVINLDAILQ